jgi:hypothetical protein
MWRVDSVSPCKYLDIRFKEQKEKKNEGNAIERRNGGNKERQKEQ